jgi:hypothetical protein
MSEDDIVAAYKAEVAEATKLKAFNNAISDAQFFKEMLARQCKILKWLEIELDYALSNESIAADVDDTAAKLRYFRRELEKCLSTAWEKLVEK